jgi:branched-chain amino acid transport system ATP-binding protein
MLRVNGISTFYGKINVLRNVSLRISEKEMVGLVGGNGVGKTTVLNTISGLVRPASGTLEFIGRRIDGMLPHQIVQLGIFQIPAGGKPFPDMTVRENLEMGAYINQAWKRRRETLSQVYQIFPILKQRTGQLARNLSGGERQILAVGRGLMSGPKLIMADEPSYGLAPIMVMELFRVIQGLRDEQGITILLVEQNIRNALDLTDRAYVLENGQIVLKGESKALLQNGHIKKAYLGL